MFNLAFFGRPSIFKVKPTSLVKAAANPSSIVTHASAQFPQLQVYPLFPSSKLTWRLRSTNIQGALIEEMTVTVPPTMASVPSPETAAVTSPVTRARLRESPSV